MVEQGVGFRLAQFLFLKNLLGRHPAGFALLHECWESPRGTLDQIDRAFKVRSHRQAHGLAHAFIAVTHKRVQHQSDGSRARMPRFGPSHAIGADFFGHFGKSLPQKMGQHAATLSRCCRKSLRVTSGGDPHRNLVLHRSRQSRGLDHFTFVVGKFHSFAAPQGAHRVDAFQHDVFAVVKILRLQDEVVRLPTRSNCHARPAARQIVNQRPVFRRPHRMV